MTFNVTSITKQRSSLFFQLRKFTTYKIAAAKYN